MEDAIKNELSYYSTFERPAIEELLINFFDSQFIKIEAAGLTPDQLSEIVQVQSEK